MDYDAENVVDRHDRYQTDRLDKPEVRREPLLLTIENPTNAISRMSANSITAIAA
jgi:hypothetical protein